MKNLSFGKQLLLCALLVVAGHIVADRADMPLVLNICWVLAGVWFVLHPVVPAWAQENPRLHKIVGLAGAALILIGCFIHGAGGDNFWQIEIRNCLGIDAFQGEVLETYDTHSGFQGDGTSYAVVRFPDDAVEQEIAAPGGWHRLPLTENLTTLIYGTRMETKAAGPFIGITMPKVENGYWYFYDRQGETTSDAQVLSRNSYNYTIGIYDADTDTLYFCKYDS